MLNIEPILLEQGINKSELARRMNTPKENLYRMLKGNLTLENIQKIADALEVNVARLFSDLSGHVEYNGTIYKITSKKDLEKVLLLIKGNHE